MYFFRLRPHDAALNRRLNWVSLLVGTVVMTAAGTLYSFSVYGPALSALGLTQNDVNLIAAIGVLGFALAAVPIGILLEWVGPFAVLLGASLGFLVGYLILYLTLAGSVNLSLAGVTLSYLLVGVATRAAYVGDLVPNIHNWPAHQHGRIVALLVVMLGLSSAIMTGIYIGALNTSSAYVLLILCLTSGLSLIGAFFVSDAVHASSVTPIHHLFIPILMRHHPNQSITEINEPVCPPPISNPWLWREMLRDSRFWLLALIHFTGTATGQLYINILGSWSLSLGGVPGGQTTSVIVLSVCNAIGRICVGSASDATLHRIKRPVFILPNLFCLLLAVVLSFFATSTVWITGIAVLVGLGYGGNAAFLATITADFWGEAYFGRNWGALDSFNGFGFLVFGQVSGAFYSIFVPSGTVYCVGTSCYLYTWVWSAVMVSIAIGANVVLIMKTPAPTCVPISSRKHFPTKFKGLSFFHSFGHVGMNLLHLKERLRRRKTLNGEIESAWEASKVEIE